MRTKDELKISEEFSYLKYLFGYLIWRENKQLLYFLIFNFLLGFIPLFVIMIFEVPSLNDLHKRSFWGDGTLVIYCFSILSTMTFHNISNSKNKTSFFKIIIWVFILLYFLFTYKVYEKAHLNFDRQWSFIYTINTISTILFLVGCLATIGIHFASEITYEEVMSYKKDVELQKEKKKVNSTNKSGNTKI